MTDRVISRRAFLRTVGVATLGAGMGSALAACQAPAAPTGDGDEAAPAEIKELTTYWGSWTPTQDMVRSEDNPMPHDKIVDVLDAYMTEHPNVQIEWIRLPTAGGNERDWMIAQQAAGTIPHIVSEAHWNIKDDMDKNWWVELTPFLDEPNPYVSSGEPGSEKWLDQFYPLPTSETRIRGGFWNVVFGMATTFFFYNVDWFNDMGLEAPGTYSEFLAVCQAFKDEGVNAYGHWVGRVSDTDTWYRIQLGGMIMASEIEPQVNPDRSTATQDEVACAIQNGIYHAHLPQYREWMELWKRTIPYREADWPTRRGSGVDEFSRYLNKAEPIHESGTWAFPRLENDPLMDFEWDTFFAPTLTRELSAFATDPPTPAWPIGGAVGDQRAVPTRSEKDGVLDEAIDLLRFISKPSNLHTIQSEIGTVLPNIKNVPIDPRFEKPFALLTTQIGETQMFIYEDVKLDRESAEPIGLAWRSYLLDQMELDDALDTIQIAFEEFLERYSESVDLNCS